MRVGQDHPPLTVDHKGGAGARPLGAHLPGLGVVRLDLGHENCARGPREGEQRGMSVRGVGGMQAIGGMETSPKSER